MKVKTKMTPWQRITRISLILTSIAATLAIVGYLSGFFNFIREIVASRVSTSSPTTQLAREQQTFSLTLGHNGFKTVQSYKGTVTITVSGTGQAKQTAFSDPLYIYTDFNENAIIPVHDPNFSLCIDDNPVDKVLNPPLPIPKYNENHIYTFAINAPGGQLTFGICDSGTIGLHDNTGFFTVIILQ